MADNPTIDTGLIDQLEDASKSFLKAEERVSSLGTALDDAGEKTLEFANNLTKNLVSGLKDIAPLLLVAGTNIGKNFANPLKGMEETAGKTITGIASIFGGFGIAISEKLLNAEGAMRNFNSAQQIMRQALAQSGQSLSNSIELIRNYPQAVREMSAATGFTIGQVNEFNKTVGYMMPDALKLTARSLLGLKGNMGEMIQPTVVAMTAFKTFGLTTEESAAATKKAFLDFAQGPIETAKNLGIMARAAKDTGVDLNTTYSQIQQASESLAIFGRKTGESANVWKSFTETLRAGGVPIKEVGEIVKSFTNSIATMSVEHRAFIGMMSGITRGSSALGGALKLEFAMRQEGGMAKNMEALTGTLAKFSGGKIITLEQATKSPQLEQQFMLQRGMIKEITGIGDTEKQNRIIEVLTKMQSGGISQIDADKALKDVFDKGKDLQVQSLTAVQRILQILQGAVGGAADKSLDDMIRTMKGKGGRGVEGMADLVSSMTGPGENIFNKERAGSVIGQTAEDLLTAGKRALRTQTDFGRMGVESFKEFSPSAMDNLKAGFSRHLQGGSLDRLETDTRRALAPPKEGLLRTRAPDAIVPMINVIGSTINKGSAQQHADLQQLIKTTETGLSSLKTPGTESTLTIKFEGATQNVMDKLKELISKTFTKDYTNNALGYSGNEP